MAMAHDINAPVALCLSYSTRSCAQDAQCGESGPSDVVRCAVLGTIEVTPGIGIGIGIDMLAR